MLQEVVEDIRASTGGALVMLFTRSSRKGSIQPLVMSGDVSAGEYSGQLESSHSELATKAIEQKTPIYSGGLDEDVRPPLAPATRSVELQKTPRSSNGIRATAAIPLWANRNVIGVLLIDFRATQTFAEPQRAVIEAFARQAALWMQQARAAEALNRRHLQELRDLQAVDREITSSLELDKVLRTILASAARHVRAIDGMIALLNPATGELEARSIIGRDAEQRATWKATPDQRSGVTQRAFTTKRPVRVDDSRNSRPWQKVHDSRASSAVSELAVPLVDGDKPVGVIDFESAELGAFGAADEDFLVTLASQAVLAIRNAETYEHARRDADERQILIDVGKEIIGHLEPAYTFTLILQKAIAITHATAGTLHLVDSRHNELLVAAEEGGRDPEQRQRQAFGEGVVGRAAASGHRINVGDVSQPPWVGIYVPFIPGIRSELAVPMYAADRVRGVINVESCERDRFGPRDEQMLTALADLAVIAIENAERYQQAKDGRQRLETLHQIDQDIIAQLDAPQGVLEIILASALRLTKAEAGDMYLYEGRSVARSYSLRPDVAGNLLFARTDTPGRPCVPTGLVDHVAHDRKTYWTRGDAQADPKYVNGHPGVSSAVAVPLLDANELVGVLHLEYAELNAFHDEHLGLLDLVAGQAVIAIQNAEAYARAARESRRFHHLYQTAQQLGRVIDLDQIERAYDIVFTMARDLEATRQVVLRRHDPERHELVVVRSVP